MKKTLGLFVAAAALAIAPATGVFAASTDSPSTPSDQTTNADASISTGDLTFNNVSASAKVADVKTSDAFNNGITGNATGGVEVDDFLGTKDTWNLSVSASGWTNSDASQSDTTSIDALNGGTLSYTAPETASTDENYAANGATAISSTAQNVASGSEGKADLTSGTFKFNVDAGANILAGDYTNTLTWSLNDTPVTPS